jgi:transcriptional repressor NrdR
MSSNQIGAVVLEQLRNIDEIAYIRFASVYQDFKVATSFISAIATLSEKNKK